jgi:hypothetical protein
MVYVRLLSSSRPIPVDFLYIFLRHFLPLVARLHCHGYMIDVLTAYLAINDGIFIT